MDKLKQLALQTAKEIVVKFIEAGRVSPANFPEVFPVVYREILRTISASGTEGAGETASGCDVRGDRTESGG